MKQRKIIVIFFVVLNSVMLQIHAQENTNPEIAVQIGHSDFISSVALSPDGKLVLTGSKDNTIKLWDAATRKVKKTITGHTGEIFSVAFSPDGKSVLSGSSDKTIKLWDTTTGKEIRTFSGHESYAYRVVFSADGKTALSAGWDNTARLWDVSTGKELRTFSGHSKYVTSVAFSPDGKSVLSFSWDNTVRLWDISTGKEIKSFTGFSEGLCVTFSPEGKPMLWSAGGMDHIIRLWDVSTGKQVKVFFGHTDLVNSIVVSPDGKYMLSGGGDKVKLWDIFTGKEIRTFTGHSRSISSVAFSRDGRMAVSGSWDKTAKLWDVSEGKELRTFAGLSGGVSVAAFSPNGNFALSGGGDRKFKLWDMSAGKELKTFDGHFHVASIAISPDGKSALAAGEFDSTVKLWDLFAGKEIRTFTGHSSIVNRAVFSPDGKSALTGSSDKTVKLWDVATGKEIWTFSGHSKIVHNVAFSPDGKLALSMCYDNTVKLLDAATGKEIRTFSGHADANCAAFSPDSASVFLGDYNNLIKQCDLTAGKTIRTFPGHTSYVDCVAVSPDGKFLLSGSADKTVKLWDISAGKEIRTFTGHSGKVGSVSFSPDGGYILSASDDTTMKLWDAKKGLLLCSFAVSADGKDYVAWTPEGFFSGTELAMRNCINIVDGMTVLGIEQVFDAFYRPDIIEAKIKGEDISGYTSKINLATLLRTGAPPVVGFVTQGGTVQTRDIKLKIRVIDNGSGIGKVTVFIDGTPIVLSEGERGLTVVKTRDVSKTYEYEPLITLRYGSNTISCTAYNGNNTIESGEPSIVLVYKEAVVDKPTLHLLAVGADKYRDIALKLKYVINDAESICNLLSGKPGLFKAVQVYKLYDEKVTKDQFEKMFDTISASVLPDDVFIFYIGGHGVTSDSDGDYYFLPADFRYTSAKDIVSQGISKSMIVKNLSKLKAQKSVLLFDTCNSGSFIDTPVSRGMAEKTAIDRLKKAIGRAIIVASSESQFALEGIEEHGVFTYALLRGLSGEADADKNGFITITELTSFVENLVPDVTYKKWGYEQVPQKELPKEDFPILKL